MRPPTWSTRLLLAVVTWPKNGLFTFVLIPPRECRGFMQATLDHRLVVGAHWFRYHDHPSGGRADGDSRSNSQNGLLDPTGSPDMETIEAARTVGHKLYQTGAGKR